MDFSRMIRASIRREVPPLVTLLVYIRIPIHFISDRHILDGDGRITYTKKKNEKEKAGYKI